MGHRADQANCPWNLSCTSQKKRARDLAEKEEEKEEGEAQTGTNKRLLKELIQQIPTYDWQAPPREDRDPAGYDRIKIPKPSEPINYKKRGEQHVKGRGKVDVSLRHPRFYMPVIRRWFNRLRWKPRQEGPNTPSNTVTMLECVVDFELFTGHCLGTVKGEVLSWAQKACRRAYYLKALVRTHTPLRGMAL